MEKEVWKDIPGFNGIYQVSTLGRARSIDRIVDVIAPTQNIDYMRKHEGKILMIEKAKNGFNYVHLYDQGVHIRLQLHRLVAITFLENPNNYKYVDFKDDNKDNMALSNLEWTDKKRRDVAVLNEKNHVDHLSGDCSNCGEKLRNFGNVNYCWCCGKKLRWIGVI